MSMRHPRVHAFGMLAGAFIISSGLAGVLLPAAHLGLSRATNPCAANAPSAPAGTPSQARAEAFSASPMQAASGPSAKASTRAGSPSASSSPMATPASSSSPAGPGPNRAPGTPSPSPTPTGPSPSPAPASQSPTATTSPTPASPTPNQTPSSQSPTPGSPNSSGPTPSPTSSSPPPASLCLSVQPLDPNGIVHPGGGARFAIWVWLTSGRNGTATVKLSAKPGSLSPRFTVCQPPGRATCHPAGLSAQAVELQAKIGVPANANGSKITLTATGTSPQAAAGASASATVRVEARSHPATGSGGGSGNTGGAGSGGTLPPGAGVALPGTLPGGSIPRLPNPVGNAGSAFPEVSPSPDPAPHVTSHAARLTDVSAGLPLSVRLISGQVVGLAILAAAVVITVARLSLRKRPRKDGEPS
jgi:hypothetical protein